MQTIQTNPYHKYIDIIILVLAMALSFYFGRVTKEDTKEFIKGDVVTNTVQVPVVSKEYYTKETILPGKTVTVTVKGKDSIIYVVDTAFILNDYKIKREYNKVQLFKDKYGTMKVDLSVQYNKLADSIRYDFTPIVQSITKDRTVIPFVSAGYNSFGYVGIGGGIFYHKIGIEGKYVTDFKNKGFEIGMKYKF